MAIASVDLQKPGAYVDGQYTYVNPHAYVSMNIAEVYKWAQSSFIYVEVRDRSN